MASRYSGNYVFSCERDLKGILAVLNATGPWTWSLRDSDEHGAYLLAHPDDSYTKVRLVGEGPPEYQLVMTYDPSGGSSPLSLEQVHDAILDRLLPAIGARSVRSGPPFEW